METQTSVVHSVKAEVEVRVLSEQTLKQRCITNQNHGCCSSLWRRNLLLLLFAFCEMNVKLCFFV